MPYLDTCLIKKSLNDDAIRVFSYDETGSTNEEAKEKIKDGLTEEALFIADSQTMGKGRRGRSFYSPPHTGIYMSYVPVTDDSRLMTVCAASAVALAIDELAHAGTMIKWVNDVYLDMKKVCVILCESTGEQRRYVIGIGVNLFTRDFPEGISSVAGPVLKKDEGKIKREELIALVIKKLRYFLFHRDEALNVYREKSLITGKAVRFIVNEKKVTGLVREIDKDGGLVIEKDDKSLVRLSTGEAEIVKDSLFKKDC